VLTGRDPEDLRARAREVHAQVESAPPQALARLAAATAARAEPLTHRAVLFASGEREGTLRELDGLARGETGVGTIRGEARAGPRLAFVFSPLRSEYAGMALDLLDRHPPFAARMAACEELLEPLLGWSLGDVLRGAEAAPALARLDVSQPILFAVGSALAELWGAFGVRPEAVLGHSVGEIAAAATCGALSLPDAARVAATWGRCSRRLEGTGAMASLPLSPAAAERRLWRWRGRLGISGFNGPSWTAVSGETAAVEELLATLAREGVKGRSMGIDAPGHWAGLAPIDGWFREELAAISPRRTAIPFYSAVAGGPVDSSGLDADYWSRNLSQPVLFETAIRSLQEAGHDAFLEIGPRPVLTGAVEQILAGSKRAVAIGSWEQGEASQFHLQLAEAYVLGVEVDWRPLCRERPAPDRPRAELAAGATGPARTLREQLLAAPPATRRRLAEEVVRRELSAVLGDDGIDPDPTRSFRDLGLDSRAALALRNRLATASGVELAKTVAFDHPTPSDLASHLHDLALGVEGTAPLARARGVGAGEPIAIVGMSCRYPGGIASPRELWELVAAGRDATGDFPRDRGWDFERLFDPDPGRPGTSRTRRGGFLDGATDFDADFFAIGPREARAMDPQQRLLLECAWEAIEAAGIDPTALRGEPVGVYAGAFASAYGPRIRDAGEDVAGHLAIGTTTSVISGRVAYNFGLEGPAVTVDTACSSSLVALHLACQALREGECTTALAGGVTVMPTPDLFVEFSRQGALSPDGRCKSFGAGGDGTAWAEGCGLLLLEPLAEARRQGRRVLAIVRGSAVNQDGASNGLTAPSARAQERVIRQALDNAGLGPGDVDAVEAHGTGTALGDPIEAGALLATYGQRDTDTAPLRLGSIKSNIGHSSAAAGAAGAIKMVMALGEESLPATLHAERPSPDVEWESGRVELLREALPWPRRAGRPRRAAISSFGISGTNAHLVLEEAPAAEPATVAEQAPAAGAPPAVPLLLSAVTETALREQAQRLAAQMRADPAPAAIDVAHSLARRARFGRRAAVVGEPPQLLAGLEALAAGAESPVLVRGEAASAPAVAFVFGGDGGAWAGMGAGLWRHSPLFAERMRACAEALAEFVDFSLEEALGDAGALARVEVAQPVLFAVMVSLAGLWRAHGVEPDVVFGDSLGELAAAHVSGALSLPDAARVVALRSRWIAGGAGEEDHLLAQLQPISSCRGELPIFSPASGARLDGRELGAAHWSRPPALGVDLGGAAAALADEGVLGFVEIGPGSMLAGAIGDATPARALATLRPEEPEQVGFTRSLAAADACGVAVDWSPALAAGHLVELPPYPFQRRRHWLDSHSPVGAGGGERIEHPLLTAGLELAGEGRHLLSGRIALEAQPWLADHAVLDAPVLPGTAFVDLALTAGRRVGLAAVEELTLEAALTLPADAGVSVQVVLGAEQGSPRRRQLQIYSRPEGNGEWVRHASGTLTEAAAALAPAPLESWPPAGAEALDLDRLYAGFEQRGIHYGPAFRLLRAAWQRDREAFAEVALDEGPATAGIALDPALFDAALHPALVFEEAAGRAGELPLPFSWRDVRVAPGAPGARALRVRLALDARGGIELTGFDPEGRPAFAVGALRTRSVDPRRLGSAGQDAKGLLLGLAWVPAGAPAHPPAALAILAGGGLDTGTHHAGLREAAGAIAAGSERARTIVVEPAATPGPGEAARRGLALVREFLAEPRLAHCRLVVVTRGAVGAVAGDDVPGPATAALWGLVRSAQAEHPGRFALVDRDEDPASAATLAAALANADGEEAQLALRAGRVLVPRLRRAAAPTRTSRLDPGGTVLITGGTGLLGRRVAAHLVRRHGAHHVLLASRRGGAALSPEDLAEWGDAVEAAACDVADRDQLRDLLAAIPAERPLSAVVHAAGVLEDATVETLSTARLEAVLAPKAGGAWNLHELTREIELDAFVLFSSLAGTIGNAGQANYAAASASLDALAAHRRARGLPAVSLAWGLWEEESSMTGGLGEASLARMARLGIAPLATAQALQLLDAALATEDSLLLPVRLDVAALRARAAAGTIPDLLRDLVPAPGNGRPAAPEPALARRLAGLPERRRETLVLDLVRDEVAAVLGHDSPAAVDPGRAFKDLGFDSLAAVDLRNGLSRATGLALSATLVFDHPTPRAVAAVIRLQLEGNGTVPAPAPADEPADDAAAEQGLRDIDGLDLAALIERGLGDDEPAARA
jgi:acyl transferase domain-containing protein